MELVDGTNEVEKLRNAWRLALGGAHGEIILRDLQYYINRQSHIPGDPYSTAFNDGQRSMATNILALIEEDSENVSHKTKVRK